MLQFCIWIHLTLAVITGVITNSLTAQTTTESEIDSILEMLESDSLKTDYLLKTIRSMNPTTAGGYIQKAISIAEKENNLKSLIELKTEEAILLNRQGQHLAGVESFLEVDSLCHILGDTLKMAAVQTNLGLSYYYAGQKDRALEHYYAAYLYYQQVPDSGALSRLLNNLAICYKETGNLQEAERFYQESYDLKKELRDSAGIATSLMNLALLCSEMGKYSAARDTLEVALTLYKSLELDDDLNSCKLSLSKILLDQGEWEQALPLITESYEYFKEKHPNSHETLLASGDMATVSMIRHNWVDAEKYLDEAIHLAANSDKLEIQRTLLKDKAQMAYLQQKYREAFNALQESYILNDSINTLSRLSLIEEMQTRFEVNAKENEISHLTTERALDQVLLERARDRNLGLLFVGVGLLVFSFILLRLYRRIRTQKRVISKALVEKESLLKEIHHRVKNNLQVISSLLSMQTYKTTEDSVLDAIKESRDRVKSMALIHQSLYQEHDLSTIDSATYIDNLTKSLFNSYNIDPDRISLNTKIDSFKLDVDIMIPLGLILNELISNALKYAFSDGREGSLMVRLSKEENGLNLAVADNGIGMPSDYDVDNSKSLGLTLVRDFCYKLHAVLSIDVKEGTYVSIAIPNVNASL